MTSRRGSLIALSISLIILGALFAAFRSADTAPRGTNAPAESESVRVAKLLTTFPGSDESSVLLVATRTDGAQLGAADLNRLGGLAGGARTQVSSDGLAAIASIKVPAVNDNSEMAHTLSDLRTSIAAQTGSQLKVYVTGGPAFGADIAKSFDGANVTLLLATILVVSILLLLTYRSPVLLWLPLLVVGLADQVANTVAAGVGRASGLHFDAGIISVLVFGAGANYSLLMISRYREELHRHEDHREALAVAWRASVPAIAASNAAVVVALITLWFAKVPLTRGLSLSGAVGLVLALFAVVFVLPPLLALGGRKVFWPIIPRYAAKISPEPHGVFASTARAVVKRPVVFIISSLALLGLMAAGLLSTSIGLSNVDRFRVQSESATGFEVMAAHFPSGEAEPITVIIPATAVDAVTQAVGATPGVVRVHPDGAPSGDGLIKLTVVGSAEPGSPEAMRLIERVRTAAHTANAASLVGGLGAEELDSRQAGTRDLEVLAPVVLVIAGLVLMILLRAVVGPLVILLVNAASAAAAIGAGAFLGRWVFDVHALDSQVPVLAFIFLVALGIDYTMFLMDRARHESSQKGPELGIIAAISHTGLVITSAGVVLAGVFAALGVLPLITLGQLGLIVSVGVLVDTIVVRTLLVPALFSVLGNSFWWPVGLSRVSTRQDARLAQSAPEARH